MLTWELYDGANNPLNPTGLMIIKKNQDANIQKNNYEIDFSCPVTHKPLKLIGNAYYSEESMLAYPVLNGAPLLMKEYAVVATKMLRYC